MTNIKFLNEYCSIIDSYGGRDKVLKALCYSAKLIAGYQAAHNPDAANRCAIFSGRISSARATLRLLDDATMIKYCMEYGLGEKEPDRIMSILGVTANIVDLLFYPVEKMCWLNDSKIIRSENAVFWTNLNSMLWTMSVYLNLMRTVRNFTCNQQKINIKPKLSDVLTTDIDLMKHRLELLSLVRLSLDFVHAASTLPKGYLWGGKLTAIQVGLLGTLSAGIGIYQILAKRALTK